MATKRAHRRIGRLLDETEDSVSLLDWDIVHDSAHVVMAFDLETSDALAVLAVAERA